MSLEPAFTATRSGKETVSLSRTPQVNGKTYMKIQVKIVSTRNWRARKTAMDETEVETMSLYIEPEHDLKEELVRFFKKHNARIVVVINALGSLEKVRLCVLGTNRYLNLAGPVELLNASGIIKKEDSEVQANVNIMIGKDGKIYAGKLSSGCVAMEPEGVTVFLFMSRRRLFLDPKKLR
jgi:predicted DNA-binding protein with PD1-like motif